MTLRPNSRRIWVWILLAVPVWVVYGQTVSHEFIHFDDPEYITRNPMVRSGLTAQTVVWAFTRFEQNNWHPVTWLSHMLDVELFGMWAGGHHLVQVFLHTLSTLVLFSLLLRSTGRWGRSAAVAGLFALHPLHVESVAWAAERKDVLCGLFSLLALWRYARWSVQKTGSKMPPAVTVYFVLALMSKPMAVSLPVLMLLLDYWPLHPRSAARGRSLIPWLRVREKAHLFVLSGIACVVALAAQTIGGAVESLKVLPLLHRLAHVPVAYAWYLARTLWPADLAVFYPHPGMPSAWQTLGAGMLVAGISWVAVRSRHRFPYLLTGWLWFLIALLPVIGIVQVGNQAVADRYTYLPQIGLFMAAVWGVGDAAASRLPVRWPVWATTLLVLTACAAASFVQVGYWSDSITLFRHSIQAAGGSAKMHNNLAVALTEAGRYSEAAEEIRRALRISPGEARSYINLGNALVGMGRSGEGLAAYREALQRDPESPEARINIAVLLSQSGRTQEALEQFRTVLQSHPRSARAHYNYANLLMAMDRPAEAERHYRTALGIDPFLAHAHNNLGILLGRSGRWKEAAGHYLDAIAADPGFIEAYNNLGIAFVRLGAIDAAREQFRNALQRDPTFLAAEENLRQLEAALRKTRTGPKSSGEKTSP
ncbi:MAG: tetratricopeptide repeat protein [Desulfobacteraceae bacterium]|nr:tetratricopeptide repeat protein [Desulfobacteraceae bacterium]